MIPVLILLLLHQSLAEKVCINISDYNFRITVPHGNITEKLNHEVKCENDGDPCFFGCKPSNKIWFEGSSACLNASVNVGNLTYYYTLYEYTNCYQCQCQETSILTLFHNLEGIDHGMKQMMGLICIKDLCPDLFRNSHGVKKAFIRVEKQIIHHIMDTSQPEDGSFRSHRLKSMSLNIFKINNSNLNVSEATIPIDVPQFHNETVSSMVVRIELSRNHHLQNLMPPIKMIFSVKKQEKNHSQLLCHYFDEQDFDWKPDGCETNIGQDNVTCNCNHATAFAVLLIRIPIKEAHWKILSHISYIGCGLSAFFSASSLVIYVFSRSHKMDVSMSIHVALSGALFLLNSTFLLTEWGATVKLEWVCEFVAALMHYSLLCCFTWMAIEALHVYLLLIKVFNTYYKHYILKMSLVGWGLPGIIVATSLCVQNVKQFYGVTQLTMSDTNQTNAICWITDDSFFYSLNLVYYTLIFIFNSGILMAVASSICKMKRVLKTHSKHRACTDGKSSGVPQKFSTSCQSGFTLLGLTCLMGITWGLAFLGSGYVNYPVLYLFCILNSLQGLFIFVWICLLAKKHRRREMEDKWSSTPVRTSDINIQ
ncbi:adhesion G protein-coupled receptor G3-like isoform X2 [Girardinichthys multiradiatus]|uniref:adhesion G protein-coupled receptor G3-like isoform X2 n=1 Tax=Girardinichthys multiradiatus TaxID=208333 RepID=UPI001FADCEB3|nr:adhesion G protein-coupled receptor G3-like isoform X2 [Girardinichthys multiradiatus]